MAEMDKKALAMLASVTFAVRIADVFLAFRGLNARNGFTDHLYNALVVAGFAVLKDDDRLLGEQIGPRVFSAIENCKIAIPIISQRYAESTRCLTELTLIMRRHAEQGLLVFPIFYEVDVYDVHHQYQTSDFGKAFDKLAKRHGPVKVQEWRETLRSVTMIKGWTSQRIASGRQGQLVKLVVAKVSNELSIERIPMLRKETRESTYEVFLIFSPAAEKGLASTLYYWLMCEKISVFNNDDQSLIGKDFACEIRNAIRHCKIFIPIFTEDFASSRSCLDNLAQMVECDTPNERKILPIFYKVNPSQKQEVSDRFGKDMLQHKDLPSENNYNRWHQSLNLVWSLGGWVSENIDNGNEGKLIKMVVGEVLALLKDPNAWSPSPEYRLNLGSKL